MSLPEVVSRQDVYLPLINPPSVPEYHQMQPLPIHSVVPKPKIFFTNLRLFFHYFRICLFYLFIAAALIAFIWGKNSFEQFSNILVAGLSLAVLFAAAVAFRYRTTGYEIATTNALSLIQAVRQCLPTIRLELVNETSDIMFIKSQIQNIYNTNKCDVVVHKLHQSLYFEGHDLLIKRILKSLPKDNPDTSL